MEKTGENGRDLLLGLLYPVTEADMTPLQRAVLEEAAAVQEEYLRSAGSGAGSAAAFGGGRIVSEKIGDVSVVYSGDGEGGIAPAARAKLMAAGLLSRWI